MERPRCSLSKMTVLSTSTRDMARRIYGMTPEKEREGKKADLARKGRRQ